MATRSFSLGALGPHAVGRAANAVIRLADPSVSREHATLFGGDEPALVDLGSRNGTRVDGRLVGVHERVPLRAGSTLHFGHVTALLHREGLRAMDDASDRTDVEGGSPGVLVLEDARMRDLYALAHAVAESDLAVLILGETGVGTEHLAEFVHRSSTRRAEKFVRVNCAALPESLLEGELFGHERGAFTGANAAKAGLFEFADRGTIFLDEIGELSLVAQAKLLRVLELGEVVRVGARAAKRVDVRVVCATNRDLSQRIADGHFRADLFYRIQGMLLHVPPLRERPADVPVLIATFARTFARRLGLTPPTFSPEFLAAFAAHNWPGNVRELRSAVQRAVVLALRGPMRPTDALAPPAPLTAEAETGEQAIASSVPARGLDADLERARIEAALAMAGTQAGAALLLGVSRRTLINRLDALRLPRPRKR